MRTRWLRFPQIRRAPGAAWVVTLLLVAGAVHAQTRTGATVADGSAVGIAPDPRMQVQIAGAPKLEQGARTTIRVEIVVAPSIEQPLLVTPQVEGASIEAVRGRLLRSDARDPTANPLVFDVPIRVLAPGTAVLHVDVVGYACAQRCQRVVSRAKQVVHVDL